MLNDHLIPRLLSNLFASCFLINFDFLVPHIAQFDNIIVLPLLVDEIVGFMFSVYFLHYKQYDNIVLYLIISIFKNNLRLYHHFFEIIR